MGGIKPAGPVRAGTYIPEQFEFALESGEKIWVDKNASKHLAEYAISKLKDKDTWPEAARLASQIQLGSLRSAVDMASKNGIKYRQMIKIDGWELVFAPPKSAEQFPTLYHALFRGK